MQHVGKRLALTAALTVGFLSVVLAQSAPQASAPVKGRIAGKPDFNGIWQANNTANWDIQNHQARPMVGQRGLLPGSVVSAAPVVALG